MLSIFGNRFCYPRLLPVSDSKAVRQVAKLSCDKGMRIVRFSHLIQSLLGFLLCPEIVTDDTFFAVAAVGGEILHFSPSYEEMYSSSVLFKEWRLSFDTHYASPSERLQLREINEAYDAFLMKHSKWISHGVFEIDPKEMYSRATLLEDSREHVEAQWSTRELRGVARKRDSTNIPNISHRPGWSSRPRMILGSNLLLGSAPAQAKEGDLICLFWNICIVALLRKRRLPTGLSEIPCHWQVILVHGTPAEPEAGISRFR